jgi:hypothetical protein
MLRETTDGLRLTLGTPWLPSHVEEHADLEVREVVHPFGKRTEDRVSSIHGVSRDQHRFSGTLKQLADHDGGVSAGDSTGFRAGPHQVDGIINPGTALEILSQDIKHVAHVPRLHAVCEVPLKLPGDPVGHAIGDVTTDHEGVDGRRQPSGAQRAGKLAKVVDR